LSSEQVKAHTLSIIRQALEAQEEIEVCRYTGAEMLLEGVINDCKRLRQHCAERITAITEGRE
jgi:hypothetical protein